MNAQPNGFDELMSRESNGIHVSLLWNHGTNDSKIVVFDAATDSAFELEVGSDNPLDVFNHPYAYAAFRKVEFASFAEPDEVESLAA